MGAACSALARRPSTSSLSSSSVALETPPAANHGNAHANQSSRPRPSLEITIDPPVVLDDEAKTARLQARIAGALREACREGNDKEVARILAKYDAAGLINLADSAGCTALADACTFGNNVCVEHLLKVPTLDVNFCSKDGKSALIRAAYNGHGHLITLLAEHGADLNIADMKGNTPCHVAIMNGFFAAATELLRVGEIEINATNSDHQTLLSLAKKKPQSLERTALIDNLISRGASPSRRSSNAGQQTPLALPRAELPAPDPPSFEQPTAITSSLQNSALFHPPMSPESSPTSSSKKIVKSVDDNVVVVA